MGRILEPEEPFAFEVLSHEGVDKDRPSGLAWNVFGTELKELVILYPEDPDGPKPTLPDTEVNLRLEDLEIRQYPVRVVREGDDLLGYSDMRFVHYDLTGGISLEILYQEDGTALLLEDGTYIKLEDQNV